MNGPPALWPWKPCYLSNICAILLVMSEKLIGFRPKADDLKIMTALRKKTGLKDSQILKLAIRSLLTTQPAKERG